MSSIDSFDEELRRLLQDSSINPGEIAFTRMPLRASSTARERVIELTAPQRAEPAL